MHQNEVLSTEGEKRKENWRGELQLICLLCARTDNKILNNYSSCSFNGKLSFCNEIIRKENSIFNYKIFFKISGIQLYQQFYYKKKIQE